MRIMFILSMLCLICDAAFAVGEVNGFVVQNVRVDKSGYGYIKFDQVLQGAPADCIASNHVSHLAFDTNTPGGKGILGLAITAQATGKKIYARGTGTCDQYGVVESWNIGWIIGP